METCPHHEALSKDVKETKDTVLKIYNKLFVDNGTESLQTFRVRTNNWIEQHDKQKVETVGFWYWLIPIVVSIGIVILDRLLK